MDDEQQALAGRSRHRRWIFQVVSLVKGDREAHGVLEVGAAIKRGYREHVDEQEGHVDHEHEFVEVRAVVSECVGPYLWY